MLLAKARTTLAAWAGRGTPAQCGHGGASVGTTARAHPARGARGEGARLALPSGAEALARDLARGKGTANGFGHICYRRVPKKKLFSSPSEGDHVSIYIPAVIPLFFTPIFFSGIYS